MFKNFYYFVFVFLITSSLFSQGKKIAIWPSLAPGTENKENTETWEDSKKVFNVYQPDITLFATSNQSKVTPAIIVCPGGGYRQLEIKKEGYKIAKWFAENGFNAFVLKYRLTPEEALQDLKQAITYLRNNSDALNIDPNKLGVIGFSAGAHLAGNLATNYQSKSDNDEVSLRPDFWIGVYGVYKPRGNVRIKENSTEITSFSQLVDKNSPPLFLVHAANDSKVSVENSLQLYTSYAKNNVPAELHIYEKGEHGFALETNRGDEITSTVNSWSQRCIEWLKIRKILSD